MGTRTTLLARFVLAAATCAGVVGCNLLTGIGSLTFGDAGKGADSDSGNAVDGGGVDASPLGPLPPPGTQLASSSSLSIQGMTSDGWVVYADVLSNDLYAVAIEEPDGGPPSSTAPPMHLGTADLFAVRVDGRVVELFSPSSEADAGGASVGALSVWSSTMTAAKTAASGVLVPDLASGVYTVVASADGRYVAYFGPLDPSGATGPLSVMDTQSGSSKTLVTSLDVLEDACRPKLAFSGPYLVASYCAVPPGGTIGSTLPDGGTNYELATLSRFDPATGQSLPLADHVRTSFAADPAGVAALFLGDAGLTSSSVAVDGGLVPIDTTPTSFLLTDDGKHALYAMASGALKRASTSAPADPLVLVSSPFNYVYAVSSDQSWVVGSANLGAQPGTSDLYLASATQAGTAQTLSSSTDTIVYRGNEFTSDSRFALFIAGLGTDDTGSLQAFTLGGSAAPFSIGTGASWFQAAAGSVVVFNEGVSAGKGDIQLRDLSNDPTPTLVVSQADGFFELGPARDRLVYTYTAGGGTDGLWVLPLASVCTKGGPIVYHPPIGPRGSCTAAEVSAFTSCLIAYDDSLSCATSNSVSVACYGCLVTPQDDASWGVVVDTPYANGTLQLNHGGCYVQEGSVACGRAFQAWEECQDNACANEGPLTFDNCRDSADTGVCACYYANADAACGSVLEDACTSNGVASLTAGFPNLAKVMCE